MPVKSAIQLDLDEIQAHLDACGLTIPTPMIFGLGAGLYFEYYRRPKESPSRFFTGHNRRLEEQLDERVRLFCIGESHAAIVSALRANAMAMNVDRSPVAGVMGMELFAEELENWAALTDWDRCARQAAWIIERTGSLYRRCYVQFVLEASAWVSPLERLVTNLEEIAGEWDALGRKLDTLTAPIAEAGFISAAQMLQHLAAREEHFWGEVIELTNP